MSKLFPKPMVKLDAPPCIDLSLRRKGRRLLIHLANTAGMQLAQNYPVIDFVPPVGPIEIALRLPTKPKKVRLVGQPGTLRHKWSPPRLRVKLERIETHVVLVVD